MKPREKRTGITLVNTGDGKGKSSAGFGVVFRAAGWGMDICVIQYIKGKWKTGEQQAASRFDNIEWHALGDGFTWNTKNPQQDIRTSREIWEFSKDKIRSGKYDLVMLDEINYCSAYGWISGEEIARFIREEKPPHMHLILTGRNAAREVLEVADTATEMKMLSHAFESGVKACQGMEF